MREVPAPQRSRESEVIDDDRRRAGGEQGQPGILRMPGEIDEDVDLRIVDRLQDVTVGLVLTIDEAVEGAFQPLAQIAVISRANRKGVGLEAMGVVALENAGGHSLSPFLPRIIRSIITTAPVKA